MGLVLVTTPRKQVVDVEPFRDTASVTDPVLTWPACRPRSGSVSLRAFEARDVDAAVEMATDPYIPLIGSLPAHADHDAALAWIHRQQARTAEGVGFSFCVADQDDRAVGSAGLWTHDLRQGRATAGYALRPSVRGQGLAAQALRALTGFAFTLPQLHRVELYVEPDNQASRRVAERAGYLLEGTLRQHQEIGGRRRDMCLYAALRTD
jgi:ribosomal-protein-alanine N-acetyltransferase